MKKILGACIGSCIHVAGVLNFLNLSDKHGYSTIFLGSACKIDYLKQKIDEYDPDIVAVSYRLSPESALLTFEELKKKIFARSQIPPQNILERIKYNKPFPVIRHHFGRPTLDETVKGIKEISQ